MDPYWSLNTRVGPWRFILPSTTSKVAQTLTSLQFINGAGDWHIAIRSGGHVSDDSNNTATGVTIDLSQLNATTYDAATTVASIGTGVRRLSVYSELENHRVSVTGGREGVLDVGGLELGGGYGFSCDTVINFEMVLASGETINANASAHSDLWRALKGGSSNFGIVTTFDLEASPARNLTLEMRLISFAHADAVVDAIAAYTDLDRSFQDSAMLTLAAYDPKVGDTTISVIEVNTIDDANTTAFDAFNRIPALTPVNESCRLRQSVCGGRKHTVSCVSTANLSRISSE